MIYVLVMFDSRRASIVSQFDGNSRYPFRKCELVANKLRHKIGPLEAVAEHKKG